MRSIAFVLLLSTRTIAAHVVRSGKWCFGGCETVVNYATFNDTSPGSKKARSCEGILRATSLYLCIDEYCAESGRKAWLQDANETCIERVNATLPPYEIIDRFGPQERSGFKRLSADEAFTWPTLDEIVIPDEEFFERAFTTLDAAFFEYGIHRLYGYVLFYFWAVVVSFGVGSRLLSLIQGLRRQDWQRVSTSPDGFNRYRTKSEMSSWLQTLLKRYITVPAAFNNLCSQPFGWCTVPTRIQSLTILAFVVLNIVLCSASYRLTDGNLYWPTQREQLLRFVSDRTGIMSLVNFPLIWLFGMRNNTLMWMTGWGFGTYNNFHRWVARVSTVQAVIHSIGYTIMICERDGMASLVRYLHKHYFWNGELATVLMCALLAFSVYGLRRSHYEIFLTLHIICSIFVLVTMYYHVLIFGAWEWNGFVYPCVAVWVFDRLLRGGRILLFNYRFWNIKATATYDSDSHIVSLRVPCNRSWLKPQPGTYYYISVVDDLLYAHQNHPFTLAYVSTDVERPDLQLPLSPISERPSAHRANSNDSSESDALLQPTASPPKSPSLVFLIRPYDGFTGRLAKRAASRLTSVRVLIEGPYGHTVPLRTFTSILFMVGGTGIAVPLSHISNLLSEASSVVSLRIVWAVREHAFLASVLRDFRALLEDERVMLEVHVTQDVKNTDVVPADGMKGVKLMPGRPAVHNVVEDMAMESGYNRFAVVACGPAKMADETRKACVAMLGKGFRGVEYFEESFKW
ncbi:ferric-chelate reductase [Paraphaeosphaeria sporulosa]|uniref:Ferric-chelate reductase n=1 Tax=Paraphaeosphaeria sporulosa TaxID=1460663 RepID=A0A177BVE7_9PLEO|nr:ferric-chelate reductase [Paraphaeosphaeria sporulosa]OAF99372.1 ferric-chelate reductase [Paraphaeosphaeria sporulosa]